MATIQPELIPATDQHWKKEDALATAITPMTMLYAAQQRGASVDELGKWMELYREWKKDTARDAFIEAMTAFRENPPDIIKRHKATITAKEGKTGYAYNYANLDDVCDAVMESLSKHGFYYRWEPEQKPGLIKITCILTHKQGHSESAALEGPHDTSGGKNPIQAIASTNSYLQRYTLLDVAGLAPCGADKDGHQPEQKQGSQMDANELAERDEHFDKCLSYQEVDAHYRASFEEAHRLKDQNAKDTFIAAKKRAYARLREKQ